MNLERLSPFVLGTAQFGSCYGIANKEGKLSQQAVTSIVKASWEQGIDRFDTAQGYGDSEVFLGRALKDLDISKKVKVISKIAPTLDHLNAKEVISSVEGSLRNLGVSKLYALLIHDESSLLLWDKGLKEILSDLVRSGKVEKIGISVYSPEKALQALNISEISVLQIPTNVLDKRFVKVNIFQIAQNINKEVYIRSIFLQGLLLMDIENIPEKMNFAKSILQEFKRFCQENNVSRQQLAIGYLRSHMPQAFLLFGAERVEQVQNNAKVLNLDILPDLYKEVERKFDHIDEKILNPLLWG
ncbi:hypothetical protein MNBD_GAMMA03-472 [hydrothermal vent metagenome]|uniref:NADP-dependent oxidoreductase domain-containing protein n=1 Tax=hydrothermal vent metagenome TaxID=652676 RepID=A0A3B0VYV5_9ZZZZ